MKRGGKQTISGLSHNHTHACELCYRHSPVDFHLQYIVYNTNDSLFIRKHSEADKGRLRVFH